MRWVWLYLRARRVPAALATSTALLAAAWAGHLLWSDSRLVNANLVALTVLLGVSALAATLGGPDEDLERTAPVRWPLRRVVHLLAAALAVGVPLALTALTAARFGPLGLVVRDLAGLLGLTALGAAVGGAGRSWIAPLGWTLVAVAPFLDPSHSVRLQVLCWPVQPAGNTAAWICAAVLAAGGTIAYAWRGGRAAAR
ncbi:hypothetical protein [Dactylosporangium sp. CA-233914]|uniref:hypothetical protein n=1 Tax=Dactylosporangium sp. CA-233914 TaxID=3239934 RepID=UPI003D934FB2